ncbi:MAG: DUF4906 domain-containing protein [Bacteroidales bacterium]|nr:DUF4906 domain-containing protein [Bacteroidales bacterium]
MSKHLFLCLILMIYVSCAVGELTGTQEISDTVHVNVSLPDGSVPESRSILPEKTIETLVTDVTLASYSDDGMLVDVRYYEGCPSAMEINVRKKGHCRLYALANAGDMRAVFPVREILLQELVVEVTDYETVSRRGIPMCGKVMSVNVADGNIGIRLERLFAKVCMRILHDGIYGASDAAYAYNLCNKSAYVRQANRVLKPFDYSGSRAVNVNDIMSESDFIPDMDDRNAYEGNLSQSQLGPGPGYFQDTTFVFYVPENMQGELLPDNQDPLRKDYSGISDINGTNYGELCTYMEFNAQRINNGVGYSGSVCYRYYLGDDNVSDFNVRRNKRYDIQLELTEKGLFADSWKVTQGNDWSDSRVLRFLEEPFVVYKGQSENIMVHYHRMTSSVTSSQKYPDDWYYEIDEGELADAGVTLTYDPDVLVKGQNGMNDYCIGVSASEDAVSGMVFPIRILSWDGALSDYATVQVAEMGKMNVTWSYYPQYVSQYGIVTVGGVPDDKKPVELNGGGMFEYARINDTTFRVVAVKEGAGVMVLNNSDGTQTCETAFNIMAPVLDLSEKRISLNPDGRSRCLKFAYRDHVGNMLDNMDESAFHRFLMPVPASDCRYCRIEYSDDETLNMRIERLYDDDGVMIDVGTEECIHFAALACSGVAGESLDVYYVDPFKNIVPQDFGRIDDYSLFTMSGVHRKIKESFQDEVASNSYFRLKAPIPDAVPESISVSMKPSWLVNFSYPNQVFMIDYIYNEGKAYFDIVMNDVDTSTKHGAGRHQVVLNVTNSNSGEQLECICGGIDVFVHALLGAEAEFGCRQSDSAVQGLPSFAEVYNILAGSYIYSDMSSSMICYMDVSVDFVTDVSGIKVFAEMQAAAESMTNDYNALDIVTPAVNDGYKDVQSALLYSVWDGDAYRVNAAGEPSRRRIGLGNMLYRALKMRTYASEPSLEVLKAEFFGSISGAASPVYRPSYYVHDMTAGEDMTKNRISRYAPFYFSPSSFPQYRDADGNGYHVIHFLDEVVPSAEGWVNML